MQERSQMRTRLGTGVQAVVKGVEALAPQQVLSLEEHHKWQARGMQSEASALVYGWLKLCDNVVEFLGNLKASEQGRAIDDIILDSLKQLGKLKEPYQGR